MTLIKYKEFDLKNVVICKPQKTAECYSSVVLYGDNEELLIQTPEITLKDPQTMTFNMVNNGQFFSVLDDLKEHLIEHIFVNSKSFFNGKEFSSNRIRNSLISIQDVDDNGNVKLYINNSTDFKVTNIFNESCETHEYPLTGKSIIKVKQINYTNKEFKVIVELKKLKLSPKRLVKKTDFDIEYDEPEIKEEIETITENVDDLEFF